MSPNPESVRGDLLHLPASPPHPADIALEELELVYAFIHSRVGNRPDAEDLTQVVAMKAIPRLRDGAGPDSIRAYLFAAARSALADFWARKFGLAESELPDEVAAPAPVEVGAGASDERVSRLLERLPANYRRVLELRFLRGYSLKEVAAETGSTVGGVKVMQLRALRAAARVGADAPPGGPR